MKNLALLCLVILLLLSVHRAHAALATAVPATSIACSAGTCTITTSAAHNISISAPGGCFIAGGSLPAADVICFTATSVPSGTTFTLNQSLFPYANFVACASSCGTVQSASQFIGFSTAQTLPVGIEQSLVCLWSFVQSPIPTPNASSACSNADFSGVSYALSEINGALSSGAWKEYIVIDSVSGSSTNANIEQEWQRKWFNVQQFYNAGTPTFIQPGALNGILCNTGGCNK